LKNLKLPISLGIILFIFSCTKNEKKSESPEIKSILESRVFSDSTKSNSFLNSRYQLIDSVLKSKSPILRLQKLSQNDSLAQEFALNNKDFTKYLKDSLGTKIFLNEVFNVYKARPQEVPQNLNPTFIYKVEMYNYPLNLTTTTFVDIATNRLYNINYLPQTQPDIPLVLKNLALKLAVSHPEVIKALGYKPNESEALMANTKTALNNTKCERSMHLCVAPTFIHNGKALWVIVDLTDYKVVGIRWTEVGNSDQAQPITERKLKFDKIMECFCKAEVSLAKQNWKFNYIITTSDGLRISEVYYKNKLVINSAKVVDWHVSYSNTDGFGYSDAVGCPEFSQAAVVAETEPRISDIIENGKVIGFALEQNFSSEQWPRPCNYNYLQRFEFYLDGSFRPAVASLGRGCGNNGTYRPVTRLSFPDNSNTFSDWNNENWQEWLTEKWQLQTELTNYTAQGYQYKIANKQNKGFYIKANVGTFGDNSRNDNAYVFVTKQNFVKDEGENDLPTIGPCCNTDYRQGPEKFMLPKPDNIKNNTLVMWYVAQLKNDNRPGKEYCWAESKLVHGVYQTKVYPCLSGPKLVPIF
jgi:hypothetical protein